MSSSASRTGSRISGECWGGYEKWKHPPQACLLHARFRNLVALEFTSCHIIPPTHHDTHFIIARPCEMAVRLWARDHSQNPYHILTIQSGYLYGTTFDKVNTDMYCCIVLQLGTHFDSFPVFIDPQDKARMFRIFQSALFFGVPCIAQVQHKHTKMLALLPFQTLSNATHLPLTKV